jgi:hypothetical protein
MIALLLVLGLLVELGLGAYVVVLTNAERKTFRRWIDRSGTEFMAAVDELPDPYKSVARPLADHLAMDQDFDEALLDAVVDTTRQPFKKPLWMRLTVGLVCSITLLAPASYGLLATAEQIITSWNEAKGLDRSVVYLKSQVDFERPLMLLRDAFHASALLFFGLAFLWALAWYLRRPEVREARFVRALLEAAARASPKSPAPVAGRLSELIAPDRGLSRPVTALAICFSGITAGWMVLYRTADVRAANDQEPVFDVWPGKNPRPVGLTEGVSLPVVRGGGPVQEKPIPSLMLSADKVTFGGDELFQMEQGRMPPDWQAQMTEGLGTKLGGGIVLLLAHKDLSMTVVMDVIGYLRQVHKVQRFDLIVERGVSRGPRGRIQAALQLDLGTQRTNALQIVIHQEGLGVSPSLDLRNDPTWRDRLREAVRAKTELMKGDDRAAVEVQLASPRIKYERFVDVLASADTACMGKGDCGLPGLGLVFTFPATPNP